MEAALRDAYTATRTVGVAKPHDDVAYVVLDRLRQQHAHRLRDILHPNGWPTITAVGRDGAHAAAWIACRCDDIEVQRCARDLMMTAVRLREAPVAAWAVLVDVIAVASGKPQVYGTQLVVAADGTRRPRPIEQPARVDTRRAAVGLPPLGDYLTRVNAIRSTP